MSLDVRSEVRLFWGRPDDAALYRAENDSIADQARDRSRFSARREAEWRVSRALLQASPEPAGVHSLSHRRGHAVVARAPEGWRLGVDLEHIRPRRVHELAQWCCTDDERTELAGLPDSEALRHFYRLWTCKEALIKAWGLDFPSGLRACGLTPASPPVQTGTLQGPHRPASPSWRLALYEPGPRARPWRLVVYESSDWICSVLVSPPDERDPDRAVSVRWAGQANERPDRPVTPFGDAALEDNYRPG